MTQTDLEIAGSARFFSSLLEQFAPRLKRLNRGNIRKLKGIYDTAKEKQESKQQGISELQSHSGTIAKGSAQRDQRKTRGRKSR
jgi:hypothetical protein